ncbi:hypothetical protein FHU29_002101 [Hoyosella altamirensis]|uniref:Uncharacterized protein n=2 Tax=Hoyosella TaxID=697025 RepID=F6EHW2_HOYSD|nr:hypothetical protein AS9A_0453 [Hoyosella subflava DQS3-9A1]MBB3037652.1 hypothetical protein [Hoyosella altamirensis]
MRSFSLLDDWQILRASTSGFRQQGLEEDPEGVFVVVLVQMEMTRES